MKYFHVVQFHLKSGGGVGSVITDLSEEMAKHQSDVYVLSLFQYNRVDFNCEKEWAERVGVKVELFQKEGMSRLRAILNFRSFIKSMQREDDCVLYLHLKWGVLAGILATLGMRNVRRVEVYHSGYMKYKLQAFVSKFFLHKYIAVSNEAKEQLIKWFGISSNKIEVVYNGVDVDYIRSKTLINNISEPEKNSKDYVSVGRLSFEKGFLDSIKAFSLLKSDNKLGLAHYIMVGDGNQRKEAELLGNGFVEFTGVVQRDMVYDYIGKADVVILPSWWEGNSILLLEVLSVGKAVAVSDIPSFREVLKFEELSDDEEYRIEPFGVVFKKNNVVSCMKAIEAIDSCDMSTILKMASWCSSQACLYSIAKQTEGYLRIAEELF